LNEPGDYIKEIYFERRWLKDFFKELGYEEGKLVGRPNKRP
jgi:hypothetical protein